MASKVLAVVSDGTEVFNDPASVDLPPVLLCYYFGKIISVSILTSNVSSLETGFHTSVSQNVNWNNLYKPTSVQSPSGQRQNMREREGYSV